MSAVTPPPPGSRRGAIILAGGRSTRMGQDKASLAFGTGTLLSRVVSILASVPVDEIVIVARRGQILPTVEPPARVRGTVQSGRDVGPTREAIARAPVIVHAYDEIEGRGPLGGLAPGLEALGAPVAFASACDVPFLSDAFVHLMFDALGDADVAIPEAEGRLHPLGAVYRRAVLPHVHALLAADRLRPVFLLDRVRHVKVPEEMLRAVDPHLRSLANLNTPGEYEAARKAFGGGR